MLSLKSLTDARPINEPPQSTRYHRSVQWGGTAIALAAAITCVIMRVLLRSNPVTSILTSAGAGISAQAALETSLPRRALSAIHHIQIKNAFVLYFILTQIYLNLPDESVEKEVVLSLLAAIGGVWITLKIESVARRRLANTAEEEPLLIPRQRKLFLEPNSKTAFVAYQVIKMGVGGAMLTSSYLGYDWHGTLPNVGMYMVGHATGVTVQVAISRLKEKIKNRNAIAIREGSTPLSLRTINIAERTIDTFGNHAWGTLFIVNRPESYLAIGSLIGFIKMTAKRQFEIENSQPSELRKSLLKMDRWMNGLIGLGFTGWMTTLMVVDSSLVDRVAIASLGGGAFVGFVLRILLNQKRSEASSIHHTLDFYTGLHPVIWILPFSYIWERMEIGDVALQNADTETLALASAAWASFGSSFAIDRALPFPQLSPILGSLFGNFFGWGIKGQV